LIGKIVEPIRKPVAPAGVGTGAVPAGVVGIRIGAVDAVMKDTDGQGVGHGGGGNCTPG
jgi:hypothetical protein